MWTRHIKIKKITDRDVKKQQDQLLFEKEIELSIHKKTILKTSISVGNNEEWVRGYLFSEGYISSQNEIKNILINDAQIDVTLDSEDKKPFSEFTPESRLLPIDIFQLTGAIQEKAILFKKTAITQSAALFKNKDIVSFSEDVSRLGAVNKAIGQAVLENALPATGLFTSSRIDHIIVNKALYCGINILISRVGVTDLAYDLAKEKGLCLVGFARGRRFNLYTSEKSIL